MIYPRPWMKRGRDKVCPICDTEFYVPPCREYVFTCSKACGYEFRKRFTITSKRNSSREKRKWSRWSSIRRAILERDINCRLCGEDGIDVHHKVPYYITSNNAKDNLVLLCKDCHNHMHKIIKMGIRMGYNPAPTSNENQTLLLERIY